MAEQFADPPDDPAEDDAADNAADELTAAEDAPEDVPAGDIPEGDEAAPAAADPPVSDGYADVAADSPEGHEPAPGTADPPGAEDAGAAASADALLFVRSPESGEAVDPVAGAAADVSVSEPVVGDELGDGIAPGGVEFEDGDVMADPPSEAGDVAELGPSGFEDADGFADVFADPLASVPDAEPSEADVAAVVDSLASVPSPEMGGFGVAAGAVGLAGAVGAVGRAAPELIAGRYRLGEPIGESRLGWTYRAIDTEGDRDVEIIFLYAAAVAAVGDVEYWLEELRNLQHLHVLPLLDWEFHPVPYLVYPAPAMRLQQFLQAGAALSPSQTLLIGLQASETLDGLSRRGITHGALTPWHCCVDVRGRLYLAEMGLDFLRLPAPSEAPGHYQAPEASGTPAPTGADVYALGLTLAGVAVGRPVARGEVRALGAELLPAEASPAVARGLAQLAPLLVQATAAAPAQRLDPGELALALRATAEMLPPPARLDDAFAQVAEAQPEPVADPEPEPRPEPQPEPAPVRSRSRLVRLGSALAVVAAAALLVLAALGGDGTPAHVVPNVVGMDWEGAGSTLARSGWEVRRLDVRVRDEAPGVVVGQLPGPGGLLDEGQVVKVQVTLGEPLIVIPADIVGLPLEEAALRLTEIGLRLGSVSDRFDLSVPAGAVVAIAEPLPELPRGASVSLEVAVDS